METATLKEDALGYEKNEELNFQKYDLQNF